MGATNNVSSGGLTTLVIKTNGTVIPDGDSIHSIDVEFMVNKIATAKVVILDGDASTGKFEASSSKTYIPGNKITIEAGYDNKNTLLFKGVICGQNIRINPSERSFLEIECKDASIATIVDRKSKTFSNKKDSDVISSIIETYSGITNSVTATTTEWPQLVQYYTTDWDFILSRAEVNSFIVTTINGKLSVIKPDSETEPVLKLQYGDNILEFNGGLNAVTQLKNVKTSSWDYKTQAIINREQTNSFAGPGNLSSNKLSEVIGLSAFQLQSPAALREEDLNNWSKAQLVKSDYSKIQGEVTCQGNTKVLPGKYIELAGLGDRFNGNHIVSRVQHNISGGNWQTEVSFGLSPHWFTEQSDVMAPPASGLLPGVNGLFTATVKKMYEDPENQYRILVDVPLFDSSGEGLWARHASFYATSGAGAFFMPEVGDEVIIGFLNEDPRFPIILGSLYSNTKRKPPEGLEPNEKNTTKAIVSTSGISVSFDDDNKIFTITTPNKNTAIFSDKDKHVTIQDENQNSIVMSPEGIQIKSAKNITVESDQNLTLNGNQGVTIGSSTGDVEINGMNVKITADTQLSVDGGEIAQINSGAELTLNSGMIMIN